MGLNSPGSDQSASLTLQSNISAAVVSVFGKNRCLSSRMCFNFLVDTGHLGESNRSFSYRNQERLRSLPKDPEGASVEGAEREDLGSEPSTETDGSDTRIGRI